MAVAGNVGEREMGVGNKRAGEARRLRSQTRTLWRRHERPVCAQPPRDLAYASRCQFVLLRSVVRKLASQTARTTPKTVCRNQYARDPAC